jgi:hypothetical protein
MLSSSFAGIRGPIKGMNATPYEQSWTLGFQHQLPAGIILDTNYVGKKGTKLFFGGASELNHLGPGIEADNRAQIADMLTYVDNPLYGYVPEGASLGGPTVQKYQLSRPFPSSPASTAFHFRWPTPSTMRSSYVPRSASPVGCSSW